MRKWRNEAGYTLEWHPVTAVIYITAPDGRIIHRSYEWWEMSHAEGDALVLAQAMNAQEVESVNF